MKKYISTLGSFVATVVLVATACSDITAPVGSTAVRAGSTGSNLLGIGDDAAGTLAELLVPPIKRTTPLPSDLSWSFQAGPLGAVSSNPAVGLKIVIPAGALATTQTITVTALSGAPVAYRFEPHLNFDRRVSLTQNLAGTDAESVLLQVLSGAHFAGDRLELTSDGLAVVTEIVPASVNLLTQSVTFGVEHFSGWIVASGRTDELE